MVLLEFIFTGKGPITFQITRVWGLAKSFCSQKRKKNSSQQKLMKKSKWILPLFNAMF
jgi:hypothetical protein